MPGRVAPGWKGQVTIAVSFRLMCFPARFGRLATHLGHACLATRASPRVPHGVPPFSNDFLGRL